MNIVKVHKSDLIRDIIFISELSYEPSVIAIM